MPASGLAVLSGSGSAGSGAEIQPASPFCFLYDHCGRNRPALERHCKGCSASPALTVASWFDAHRGVMDGQEKHPLGGRPKRGALNNCDGVRRRKMARRRTIRSPCARRPPRESAFESRSRRSGDRSRVPTPRANPARREPSSRRDPRTEPQCEVVGPAPGSGPRHRRRPGGCCRGGAREGTETLPGRRSAAGQGLLPMPGRPTSNR